ncbi:hypothetical protein AB5J62_30460 [Amycolatopsis sp. cg5]|uniref:hypothetical protein n=1 Tax=Amycolatopsis sp. cg5 TaxID=3238802 RepID=UPI003523E5DE
MIFDLDPPRGVAPVLIGMGIEEARNAMGRWGLPEDVVGGITPGLRVRDPLLAYDVFAHFEDGSSVTAIEVWRPLGESPASVVWRGIDIFKSPADIVLMLRSGSTGQAGLNLLVQSFQNSLILYWLPSLATIWLRLAWRNLADSPRPLQM